METESTSVVSWVWRREQEEAKNKQEGAFLGDGKHSKASMQQ